MIPPTLPVNDTWHRPALAFLREFSLCFVLFTLVLVWRQEQQAAPSELWLMRAGMMRDLVAELPTGRQAAVSSLALMPLATVTALPFLLFLPPSGYGYAYLYALAALLALAAPAWRALLRGWGMGRGQWLAPVSLAVLAGWLGPTNHGDLLACLAMLLLAWYFEQRDLAELRALAGVFWGLVLFAHVLGLALLGLRLVAAGVAWWRWRRVPEERAVRWIQGTSALYLLVVYLFLNWMIMGTALYPWRAATWTWPLARITPPMASLDQALSHQCQGLTPVVSGPWGYVIQPLLRETHGYHFVDFDPAKLPREESRPLVLVVPTPGNPLARWQDSRPATGDSPAAALNYLRLGQTPDWIFYLIDPLTYAHD